MSSPVAMRIYLFLALPLVTDLLNASQNVLSVLSEQDFRSAQVILSRIQRS